MSDTPKPTMRTLVQHGLEILAQAAGQRLNINPAVAKSVSQGAIDRFVQENVADDPLSLEGLAEDAGFISRRRRLK